MDADEKTTIGETGYSRRAAGRRPRRISGLFSCLLPGGAAYRQPVPEEEMAHLPRRRRGIALIVTLGLLFVVLLIAFSFSVSMHTERLAAGAHLEGTWARQALFQPLTLAQRDIQHHAGIYPNWTARKPSGPFEYGRGSAQVIRGMDALVTNYLPASVRSLALAQLPNLFWYNQFHVGSTFHEEIPGQPGTFYDGYPVYVEDAVCGVLMVNCSGLLDVHVVGAAGTNRMFGTSPAEIRLDSLSADERTLVGKIKAAGIVESFPEMTMKGGSDSSNLFCYSHFPVGQFWSFKKAQVGDCAYIGPDMAKWNDAKILDSLDESGFPNPADRALLLADLRDYVDPGSYPASLTQGSQEPVPGFNEWAVSNYYSCTRIDATQYQFSVAVTLCAELFNGHLSPSNGVPYDVFIRPVTFNPTKAPPGIALESVNVNQSVTVPALSNLVVSIPFTPRTVTVSLADSNAWASAGRELNYDLTVTLPRLRSGAPVDQMNTFSWTITNALPRWPGVGEIVTNTTVWARQFECLDPRFNWDITLTNYWRSEATHTLGSNNTWAVQYVSDPANKSDGDFMMYCANGPMKTVGEIGYLVYAPWKTIRICVSPLNPGYNTNALSAFTLYDTNVVKAVKGLVNPNTEHAAALDCVFNGMPVDRYPGDGYKALSSTQATAVADSIQTHVYGDPGVPKYFWNVADIGGVTNLFGSVAKTIGATNEFLRESILRNSAGLLNTRQQLYTFFMVASYVPDFDENYNPISKGTITTPGAVSPPGVAADTDQPRVSERRAVALFWRDAWSGESFLRFFKMLDPSDFE